MFISSSISLVSKQRLNCTYRHLRKLHVTRTMMRTREEQISILQDYSACDVSDALLKLQKPGSRRVARAGHLADIVPFAPASPFCPAEQPKIIAPASTLKLVDKTSQDASSLPENETHAIPKGSHWADITQKGTILVIDQPEHHTCAAVGGIMATRMRVRELIGCVVAGRVRDLAELKKSGLPIWATGRSTVGQGAEAKVLAHNINLSVNDVDIVPGDIIFCDPLEGVVVIPQDMVDQVIELMIKLVQADDKVKEDVATGAMVSDSFKKYRA